MAEWLEKKEELGGEFAYNIQVWEECRRNAVAFLGEANARLQDERFRHPFAEAEKYTRSTHAELKADRHPKIGPLRVRVLGLFLPE
jgi:hypothetical protein